MMFGGAPQLVGPACADIQERLPGLQLQFAAVGLEVDLLCLGQGHFRVPEVRT